MSLLEPSGPVRSLDGDLEQALLGVVDTAIAITDADFGNVRLFDAHGNTLRMVAQRNFPPEWLECWRVVGAGQGSCGLAHQRGERVIVEDIESSALFSGLAELDVHRRAGVRASQSTPVVSRSGRRLGMFSTHYRSARRPDGRALVLLDLLARNAAEIIERFQAEEQLRLSELKYRLLAENANDCIFWIGPDGRFRYLSPSCQALTGYPPQAFIDDPELMPAIVHPEDRARYRESLSGAQAAPGAEALFRITAPDGRQRWFGQHCRRMLGDRGEPLGVCGSQRNITDRKLAEERRIGELTAHRDLLLREVNHRIKNHLHGLGNLLSSRIALEPGLYRALEQVVAQIFAMGTVYGLQSERTDALIRLGDILKSLADLPLGPVLVNSVPRGEVLLSDAEAVPVALVLNELLNNATRLAGGAARPVRVCLDVDDNQAQILVRSGPARLPADFDFPAVAGQDAGLELIASLLPTRGAELSWRQEGDEVVAQLRLAPPVVTLQ